MNESKKRELEKFISDRYNSFEKKVVALRDDLDFFIENFEKIL